MSLDPQDGTEDYHVTPDYVPASVFAEEFPTDSPLLQQVERAEVELSTGDVVRWTDKGYTYAAVMVHGTWYLTGGQSYYGTHTMSPEQLVKVLHRSHISQVDYATAWTTLRITD